MARTYRDLWADVTSWENLLSAYAECRRRKRSKPDAARFDFHRESELVRLHGELRDGAYQPGAYRNFYINDPKRRKISAAPFRDRIVHHAVVRVLEPIYERRFIFDSYACRRGKGTHRCLDRAQQYLRRHRYYLKTDIVRFFPNVDHEALLSIIGRTIRDDRLMELIRRIVASGEGVLSDEATCDSFAGDDLFSHLRAKGLPIGNLTSQFFANVLLDQIDHYVKETLCVPGYVRYADDLLLFGDNKRELWSWRGEISRQMARLRLKLHPHKTQVRPSLCGVTYLGLRLRPDGRRLPRQAVQRFRRRVRRLRWLRTRRLISANRIGLSLRGWVRYAVETNSTGIRRDLWLGVRF